MVMKKHGAFYSEGFTKEELYKYYHPHWGLGPDNKRHYYLGPIPLVLHQETVEGKSIWVRRRCTDCGEWFDMELRLHQKDADPKTGVVPQAELRDQPQCPKCRGKY